MSKKPFIPILNSSQLSGRRYFPESKTLDLKFKRGDVYSYFEVEQETYTGLVNSESPGAYFHKKIKTQHTYVKQSNGI